MQFHGKEYTEVKDRLKILYGKSDRTFPNAYCITHIEWHNDDFSKVVIKASIYPNTDANDHRVFSGLAYEERMESSKEVNFAAWVENCETSAIGRALANADIGVTNGVRPSAEEMGKVERSAEKPDTVPAEVSAPRTLKKIIHSNTSLEHVPSVIALNKDLAQLIGPAPAQAFYDQTLEKFKAKSIETATIQTRLDIKDTLNDVITMIKKYLNETSPDAKTAMVLAGSELTAFTRWFDGITMLM